MSRTTVLAITPGEGYEDIEELRNSHGSAPPIWDRLTRRYLGPHKLWLMDDSGDLWKLVDKDHVPKDERAMLAFTFDRCYVEREHFPLMAGYIRSYLAKHPIPEDHANHWPRIAEILDTTEAPAVGLHVTSVSENPFDGPWNEEKDERDPIDWDSCYSLFQAFPALLPDPKPVGTI